jgi:hypothetical protein
MNVSLPQGKLMFEPPEFQTSVVCEADKVRLIDRQWLGPVLLHQTQSNEAGLEICLAKVRKFTGWQKIGYSSKFRGHIRVRNQKLFPNAENGFLRNLHLHSDHQTSVPRTEEQCHRVLSP